MPFKRPLKRPLQQVVLLVWFGVLCTWSFFNISRTTSSQPSQTFYENFGTRYFRWTRGWQASMGSNRPDTVDEDIAHPRIQQRPQPNHVSVPLFPDGSAALRPAADDGIQITTEEIGQYVTSIWDLQDSRFWRTECDGQQKLPKRYEILRTLAEDHHSSDVKYFLALDLYQVRKLLPRLMGTLVQVVKMLGPTKCAVSVVEGRSDDGTYAILSALKEKLEEIGTRFYLQQSDINPREKGVDRIAALSELRNMALDPLTSKSKNEKGLPIYDHETIITFVNDIAVCPEDVYELLFQHIFQAAHQTCAMDWISGGDLFYDSWVSRSMSGDLFFEVPQDVSFAFAENMFWDHPPTKKKYKAHQPFQVYSCWGGMVTLSSAPFIDGQIEFRNSSRGECYAGEPVNLAKDLWQLGYGKILTVPTVNVAYSSPEGSRAKKRKGWVHQHVDVGRTEDDWKGTERIEWQAKPPGQVKCMPGWGVVWWTDP